MMLSSAVSLPPLTHYTAAHLRAATGVSGSYNRTATNHDPTPLGARFNSAIALKLQRSAEAKSFEKGDLT